MSLDLLDWRRRVVDLYAQVRADAASDPPGALARFREGRDELFGSHPESPIPEADRRGFAGLPWWPYDPAWRFEAHLQARPAERLTVHSGTGEAFTLVRLGAVETPAGPLDVHWIDVYGGGLFLPFGDATNGRDTYGGGRYLLDTVKGADLGGTTTTPGPRLQLRLPPVVRLRRQVELPPRRRPATGSAGPVEAGERL